MRNADKPDMRMVWCVENLVWTEPVTNGSVVLTMLVVTACLVALAYWLGRKQASTITADLRALSEAIDRSHMIIEMGMDGTILRVNDNYTRYFGFSPDELVGRHAKIVVPEADIKSGAYESLWELLQRGECQTGQFQRVKKNGESIWVEASFNPILNSQGIPSKVVGLLSDVSSQVRVEKERTQKDQTLRKSEQFLEETGRLAGVGGWELDLESEEVTWLPGTYRLFGADPAYKPTLQSSLDMYTLESRPLITAAMEKAKTDGSGWDLELSVRRMDGPLVWARVVGQARCEGGRPVSLFGAFQDITARVEERLALQWATQRAELAAESGGIGVWEWDILSDKMIFDARVMRLYDLKAYAYHPISCHTWMQYLHPDDRAAAEQDLQDSLDGKRPFDSWFRILRDDGDVRYVRTTGKIIRDEGGRPVKMLGTNIDMTERRQIEDSLRSQANLLDLSHDAILVRDLDGTIRFWSQGAKEIYGFSKKQAVGQVSHQLLQTAFPASPEEIDRAFLEKGRWEGELIHTRQSGSQVVVASRWALKRDEDGRAAAVMEINSDITERKQAEEALRQSTEKEQLLIHGVRDYAIIMLDPQGNITTWNEGAEHIKGYKAEEILGRHFSVFYPAGTIAEGMPDGLLAQARREGRCEDVGWRVRKDGSCFWANVVITALHDSSGELRGYGKVTRDITDRKLAEEATEKAREAADLANRAKSDFLANMSHEVRTPVNAIMGMVHLALRADPGSRQRTYLEKIDTAAQRLLSTINDILDFSKIEVGKLKLDRIDFRLSEVMQHLRDIVEHKAHEKRLALGFTVAPDLPDCLLGDPLRLGQVLINLVNNAVKFTERGEVLVKVEKVPDSQPMLLRFAVTDTGIGMTPLQMENIFQAFHQADTSFTRQYGGTGLGLAISKHLVELMGGTIGIESELAVGSTFHFTVPLIAAEFPFAKQVTPHTVLQRTAKILVVDDNETTRDDLVQLLRHHGQQAYGSSSGEEALQLLTEATRRNRPYSLVVLDWRLPGMNGVETSRLIRNNFILQPTPIILMISAFDRHDIVPPGKEVHFDQFLSKPIKEESFLNSVWSLLETAHQPALQNALVGGEEHSLAGKRVLLVEDNDLNRDLAQELLKDLSIRVTTATDGEAGVNAVAAQPFDLVLMDIQMPIMDGLTATMKIRADSRFSNLPIIAMTAHAMKGDRERSLAVGMNDHITKPIDPQLLTSTLRRWLLHGQTSQAPPAAESMKWIIPEHLGPFHLAAALVRTNNKPNLLRKLLLGFRQQYSSAVTEMNLLLQQGHWPEALTYAHSLKGIAATLEDKQLAQAAAALETALRNGQTTGLNSLIDELSINLESAIAAIATLDQIPAAAV